MPSCEANDKVRSPDILRPLRPSRHANAKLEVDLKIIHTQTGQRGVHRPKVYCDTVLEHQKDDKLHCLACTVHRLVCLVHSLSYITILTMPKKRRKTPSPQA